MGNHDERLRADGKMDEAKGKAKEKWGEATNDLSDQAAGKLEQLKGKAKQATAEVMDEIGDAADAVDGDVDGN